MNNNSRYLLKSIVFVGIMLASLGFVKYSLAQELAEADYLDLEREIINQLNQERLDHELQALQFSAELRKAAEIKVKDIIEKKYFLHISPDGIKAWDLLDDIGYDYKFAGENLAMKFEDAEGVHTAWMESKSHRENMLFENYSEVAVAIDKKEDGTLVVVEFFGKPMSMVKEDIVAGAIVGGGDIVKQNNQEKYDNTKELMTQITASKKLEQNMMGALTADQIMSLNNIILLLVGVICLILVVNVWVLEKEDEKLILQIKQLYEGV